MTEEKEGTEAKNGQRRRMLAALVILLLALFTMLVKNHALWFGGADNSDADETEILVSAPSRVAPAPLANKPVRAAKTKNEAATKGSAEPAVAASNVVATTRTELPPLQIEVVEGNAQSVVLPDNNSLTVGMSPNSHRSAAGLQMFEWSSATNVAERTAISADQSKTLLPPAGSLYPSLASKGKVEGSVLLLALVAADGEIESLRVLSGDPILASAALEAARQWRFRPLLHNGQPVETQAKVMVTFKIKLQ